MRVELSTPAEQQAGDPPLDLVRLSRARLAMRKRRRVAVSAGFAACFVFGCILTYTKGLQALEEILSSRPRPVLAPVAAAPAPGRQARQIPMNADMTPVATITAPAQSQAGAPAPAFRPVERAPGYGGFQVTAGR